MHMEILEDKVIVAKKQFFEEIKIQYLNFILFNEIKQYIKLCNNYNVNYEFCDYVSRHFLKSHEGSRYSLIHLQKWLDINKEKLNKLYEDFKLDKSKYKPSIYLQL